GLNGTVVPMPHSAHVVWVSGSILRDLPLRFALHRLQCLGMFLKCRSKKNACSSAVNTNSSPQLMHVIFLSRQFMAFVPPSKLHLPCVLTPRKRDPHECPTRPDCRQ